MDLIQGYSAFFICQRHASNLQTAHVALKYKKHEGVELPKDASLATFCFPVVSEMHITKRVNAPEVFCFTMTGDTGDRVHGFCRKIYWSSAAKFPKFPIVLCILSDELWSVFYYKVLEILEQLLLQERSFSIRPNSTLAPKSAAALFLEEINAQLSAQPMPGAILTVHYPPIPDRIKIEPPKTINTLDSRSQPLKSTSAYIELQIPPLTGGSPAMASVSLARLLWRVPVQCLMTLIASLFLERRIIMICKTKDTLAAAVHAAAALIYPFEWPHRFYLPIMPEAMRTYLQAPFPFLVGLPAELLDFKGLEMDEVTLIDLDLGTCMPEAGSVYDDAHHLPMRQKLESALHEAVRALRSPMEFEGNMRVSEIMTGYVVRLFKNYRQYIRPKSPVGIRPRGCFSSPKSRKNQKPTTRSTPLSPVIPKVNINAEEAGIEGNGFFFDHAAFVSSHRSKTDRAFLDMFRQSQMYEVFIQQRLEMASLGVYPKDDPFEYKINLINNHAKKLIPGHLPSQNWSKRLLSKKLMTASERLRKTMTLGDASLMDLSLEPLIDSVGALETKSTRRLLNSPKRATPSFSKTQSIKNIVIEMARQSTRKIRKPEPGNFLQVSRASVPGDEKTLDADDGASMPLAPYVSPKIEDETSESSSDSEIIAPAQINSRDLGPSIPSLIYTPSLSAEIKDAIDFEQWEELEESERKNAWVPGGRSEGFHHEKEVFVTNRGLPNPSEKFSPFRANEVIPRELRFSEEAEDSMEAFVESNLDALSHTNSAKLGVSTPSQENKREKSLRFGRCSGFSLQ